MRQKLWVLLQNSLIHSLPELALGEKKKIYQSSWSSSSLLSTPKARTPVRVLQHLCSCWRHAVPRLCSSTAARSVSRPRLAPLKPWCCSAPSLHASRCGLVARSQGLPGIRACCSNTDWHPGASVVPACCSTSAAPSPPLLQPVSPLLGASGRGKGSGPGSVTLTRVQTAFTYRSVCRD